MQSCNNPTTKDGNPIVESKPISDQLLRIDTTYGESGEMFIDEYILLKSGDTIVNRKQYPYDGEGFSKDYKFSWSTNLKTKAQTSIYYEFIHDVKVIQSTSVFDGLNYVEQDYNTFEWTGNNVIQIQSIHFSNEQEFPLKITKYIYWDSTNIKKQEIQSFISKNNKLTPAVNALFNKNEIINLAMTNELYAGIVHLEWINSVFYFDKSGNAITSSENTNNNTYVNVCQTCNGLGQIEREGNILTCPDCNGTGWPGGKKDLLKRISQY